MYHNMTQVFGSSRARAEAFFGGLRPVAEALMDMLDDLSDIMTEVAGPLLLVKHICSMSTPPFIWLVEQLAEDAYHLAHKEDRDKDIAAIHFLLAAWGKTPRTAETWHDIGHNLGTVCVATVGV